jgi:tetratricopeptide (TPR) repeat protein
MEAALGHYSRALEIARHMRDPVLIAKALYNISSPIGIQQGRPASFAALDEGLALAEAAGDRKLIGLIHWGRGTAYYMIENRLIEAGEKALHEYLLAAEYLGGTGATYEIGWTERMLGTVLLAMERYEEAIGHLRNSLNMFVEAGDMSALPLHVADFADLAIAKGDYDQGLILAGAAHALQAVSETNLIDVVERELSNVDQAIDAVGREKAEKLLVEGQNLSVEQILEMVREG